MSDVIERMVLQPKRTCTKISVHRNMWQGKSPAYLSGAFVYDKSCGAYCALAEFDRAAYRHQAFEAHPALAFGMLVTNQALGAQVGDSRVLVAGASSAIQVSACAAQRCARRYGTLEESRQRRRAPPVCQLLSFSGRRWLCTRRTTARE